METRQDSDRLPVIAIVVPCYNEEAALPLSAPVLCGILDKMAGMSLISPDSYILCVDDGSRDATWKVIDQLHKTDRRLRGITLTHNRGHQYALLAGLMTVIDRCDAAISSDADLQDDPEAMIQMVRDFREGKEVVFGVRASRRTDTTFKRQTAHAFYSFQKVMGLETVYDHADYRLMSNRALKLLSEYGESNVFLRGIVPQLGLDTSVVKYDRTERCAGESKYPLSKMLALSIDGITSFSARPMRWIFYIGLLTFLLTLAVAVYVLVAVFSSRFTSPGWASILLSIWGIGSILMMSLGIVGEYIGKIFVEVKHRPRYAVKSMIWD